VRMVKPLRSSSVLALTAVLASGVAVAVLATPAAEASAPAWSAAPTWSRLTTALFARSAPVLANLGPYSTPSIVTGDTAGHLHGFAASNGASVAPWADIVTGGISIDAALSSNGSQVFVPQTAGPNHGVISAWSTSTGARTWAAQACASHCNTYSGLTVAGTYVFTGGNSQLVQGESSATGATRWTYMNSDTTNSTPAVATLGEGLTEVITTNDQTPNSAVGAVSGGHLRIFSAIGQPLCDANIGGGPASPGSFDSSPAVASFGAAPMIIFGSGQSGAQPNRMMGYNSACELAWVSSPLAGQTVGAPAIANALGTGRPVVIEEVVAGASRNAVVYELDGATGQVLRAKTVTGSTGAACTGFAQGTASSVVTADVSGTGHQDLILPAGGCGVVVLDGRTLGFIAQLGANCAIQNTPIVDAESGAVGITMAGYRAKVGGGAEGCVYHYRVPGGSTGALGWPEFHHDASLTGAMAQHFAVHDALRTTQAVASGQTLISSNGLYKATMSTNGTFTVFQRSSSSARWSLAGTSGAVMKAGYSMAALVATSGANLWHTPAYATSRPLTLVLCPSGVLALIAHPGNQWAPDTVIWKK